MKNNKFHDTFTTRIAAAAHTTAPSLRPTPTPRRCTTHSIAEDLYYQSMNHIYDSNGNKETIDLLINGKDSEIWTQALSNKLGRLAQGNDNGVEFTDCFEYIYKHKIPKDRKVTYANFVCEDRTF